MGKIVHPRRQRWPRRGRRLGALAHRPRRSTPSRPSSPGTCSSSGVLRRRPRCWCWSSSSCARGAAPVSCAPPCWRWPPVSRPSDREAWSSELVEVLTDGANDERLGQRLAAVMARRNGGTLARSSRPPRTVRPGRTAPHTPEEARVAPSAQPFDQHAGRRVPRRREVEERLLHASPGVIERRLDVIDDRRADRFPRSREPRHLRAVPPARPPAARPSSLPHRSAP